MSLQNLLELDDRRDIQIPERDTDSDRPKPRPRRKSKSPKIIPRQIVQSSKPERDVDEILSSAGSAYDISHDGKENYAFEYYLDDDIGISKHGTPAKTISSDSDSMKVKHVKSKVATAEIHDNNKLSKKPKRQSKTKTKGFFEEDDNQTQVSSACIEDHQSSYQVENERTKMHSKYESKTNENESDDSVSSRSDTNKQRRSGRRHASGTTDEYLAVPMPFDQDEKPSTSRKNFHNEDVESQSEMTESTTTRKTVVSRWKKAAQNFLKSTGRLQNKNNEMKSTTNLRKQQDEENYSIDSTSQDENVELKQISTVGRESKNKFKFLNNDISEDEDASTSLSIKSSSPEKKVIISQRKRKVGREKRKRRDVHLDLLLGVTVHGSDMLPLDSNIIHPVVKVTILYDDGSLLTKSNLRTRSQNRDNVDSSSAPEQNEGRSKSSRKRKGKKNLKTRWRMDCLLPIMTQPCQITQRVITLAPTWNELLLFDEPFSRFITQQDEDDDKSIIVFFEVMDFLPMGVVQQNNLEHGTEPGWHKIAWAFLKPKGANDVLNIDRKLRLQLYKPQTLRPKEMISGPPEVYSWWKLNKKEKLRSTLYVTLKGICPPEATTTSLRTLLSMKKEHLTQAILESELAATKISKKEQSKMATHTEAVTDLTKVPQWTRKLSSSV